MIFVIVEWWMGCDKKKKKEENKEKICIENRGLWCMSSLLWYRVKVVHVKRLGLI